LSAFICAAISALPSSAQEQSSQPASTRDLQSIIEAKVLRVAITQFDLPGFPLPAVGRQSGRS
jgi:hypothetical protein